MEALNKMFATKDMININMRCIEMLYDWVQDEQMMLININMRCIEMLKKYAQHAKIGRLTLT